MKISQYYNLENIVSWIKSISQLIIYPRKFIADLENKKNTELISQFSFYFIIYTAFFIFITTDFAHENLLKQSTLVLIKFVISLLSIFIVSLIIYPKSKVKYILLFVVSILLLFIPLLIIIKSLFLSEEDYNFEFLFSLIEVVLFIYINYITAFVISNNWKKIVQFLILNFLILNCLFVIKVYFNIDNNSPIFSDDPIINEYYELYTPLECMDEIPAVNCYTIYKDSIKYSFVLMKVSAKPITTTTNNREMVQYKKGLEENIKHLVQTKYIFKRNADISIRLKKYFNQIQSQLEQKYFYPTDLREEGFKLDFVGLPKDTIIVYSKVLNTDDLKIKRQELADYHNSLIESKNQSMKPIIIANNIQYKIGLFILNKLKGKSESNILVITDFDKLK